MKDDDDIWKDKKLAPQQIHVRDLFQFNYHAAQIFGKPFGHKPDGTLSEAERVLSDMTPINEFVH